MPFRRRSSPDIHLVITHKNWVALDGLSHKQDALSKQDYGSVTTASLQVVERGSSHRILGSQTIPQLVLE